MLSQLVGFSKNLCASFRGRSGISAFGDAAAVFDGDWKFRNSLGSVVIWISVVVGESVNGGVGGGADGRPDGESVRMGGFPSFATCSRRLFGGVEGGVSGGAVGTPVVTDTGLVVEDGALSLDAYVKSLDGKGDRLRNSSSTSSHDPP
jgi:hypothetical protein